jgi:hypothetical protein
VQAVVCSLLNTTRKAKRWNARDRPRTRRYCERCPGAIARADTHGAQAVSRAAQAAERQRGLPLTPPSTVIESSGDGDGVHSRDTE